MNDRRPIGIFDSGVGGLTVAKEIRNLLPNENLIYFGDSKHLPYGDKSRETIVEFSKSITQFLLNEDCKAIVVACNTASSNGLDEIKTVAGDVPVIDVISPVAEKVAFELHQKIGVMATKATVNTGVYKKAIRKRNRHIKVVEMATPLLVPVIEEGLTNSEISRATIEHYLSYKKFQDIDSIILGCTHYPLIEPEVKNYFQGKVKVINSPFIVGHALKRALEKENLLAPEQTPEYHFYVSDITPNFEKLAKRFFGRGIKLELKMLH